ncbi:hypothetical protein FAVG1_09689 [Fusarium avenaceum]|nr:hypothetical protein FAVG1_09689 [Fusarium avenaceum]
MPSSAQEDRQRIESWLLAFHASSKTLDADQWVQDFFTDDITLKFANNPVISGDDLRPMFKNVFANLDMMTHDIEYFDYVPPRIYQAATVRYLVKGDDPEKDIIQIPGFSSLSVKKGNDGKLRCYHAEIFLDASPVFQRIAEKAV